MCQSVPAPKPHIMLVHEGRGGNPPSDVHPCFDADTCDRVLGGYKALAKTELACRESNPCRGQLMS
jgi:hypothetical protein